MTSDANKGVCLYAEKPMPYAVALTGKRAACLTENAAE